MGRTFNMFIECDDATAQNGQKTTSKTCRGAIFLRKVPPKLSYDANFTRLRQEFWPGSAGASLPVAVLFFLPSTFASIALDAPTIPL
jgi:hypothetical protein